MRHGVDKSFKKSYWKDWIWKLARWYFVCMISEVKDKTKKYVEEHWIAEKNCLLS